jgi:hypothetical protein
MEKKKNKFIGKVAPLIVAAGIAMSGCEITVSEEDLLNSNGNTEIEFPDVIASTPQSEVTQQIREAKAKLQEQSSNIGNYYESKGQDWREKYDKSPSPELLAKIAFARNVQSAEEKIQKAEDYHDTAKALFSMQSGSNSIINEICTVAQSQSDATTTHSADILRAKIEVYQLLKYYQQRKIYGNQSEKDTIESSIQQKIDRIKELKELDGSDNYSLTGTTFQKLRTLNAEITWEIDDLDIGDSANIITQNGEDIPQFRAFIDDNITLSHDVDLPRTPHKQQDINTKL